MIPDHSAADHLQQVRDMDPRYKQVAYFHWIWLRTGDVAANRESAEVNGLSARCLAAGSIFQRSKGMTF